MWRGVRVIGSTLHQVGTHVLANLVANVVAAFFSVPVFAIILVLAYLLRSYALIPLGLILLVGVLPCPSLAGVQHLTGELAHGSYIELRDQWVGLQHNWRFALRAWLIGTAITIVLFGNLAFYVSQARDRHSPIAALAAPFSLVWLLAILIWLALNLYVYPLLLLQEVQSVRVAYRNALIMVSTRKLFTLVVLPFWLVILALTWLTGLGTIIGLAFAASLQQNAVAKLLPTFDKVER